MSLILKKVYIDKLDDIINEYNNAYYSTVKMNSTDATSNTYIDLLTYIAVESNDNCSKLEVGRHVQILKYENIFKKLYTPSWSERVL